MRTIAIINQKGGCGKTTTAINLSACLARMGQKTLLVDMDPQGHCAVGLAVPEEQVERSIFDVLVAPEQGRPTALSEIVWQIATDFDLAPSNVKLAGFEQIYAGKPGREDRLRDAIAPVDGSYQWCIIDCPPTVGLITFNALRACDEVIVPVETGYFSLHGLAKVMETLDELREMCDQEIVIRVLPTLYDTRTKLAREVLAELRAKFRDYLMESTINFNTKLKEAASFGQPITEYDPGCRGYKDFANLARELMGTRPAEVETAAPERLSRPAELVQRARQLAQLTSYKFGRPAQQILGQTPAMSSGMSNGPMLADADLDDDSTPIVDVVSDRDLAVTTLEREDILDTPANATMNVRMPAEPKTIEQKIEEIYGVQREPDGITFRTRFEGAEQVTVAGDFNNWNAMSTPLSRVRPGVFMAKLSLRPGRYRYRLIVDGRWVTDPYNTYVEANSFGELNNVVEVD